eukprot:TRINITY_DN4508_c0_g1_i2.p1 TRINITY_DN4508_c0_g1~~TRINITY_DN4508_c0_g1_i2.p1  ORF type:complete len:296 (+),score=74.53 TRINITY_DN4508_c0_g1_i2:259-1146(+)
MEFLSGDPQFISNSSTGFLSNRSYLSNRKRQHTTEDDGLPDLVATAKGNKGYGKVAQHDIHDDDEEVPQPSMAAMYLTMFLGNAGFTIVIPSLWPYLNDVFHSDKTFLGFAVGAFSLGQFIVGPLLGAWSNRRTTKEVLLSTFVVIIGGNFVYSLASSQWYILIGRLIIGAGAANVGVARAYVSHASTPEERTHVMTIMSAMQAIGFIMGPAMGAGLSFLNFDIGPFHFNKYTIPGYFSILLTLINMTWILFSFQEVDTQHLEIPQDDSDDEGLDEESVKKLSQDKWTKCGLVVP